MYVKEAYYLNEIGAKKNQEDFIWPRAGESTPHDKVFMVCDGVGGSQNGEIASKIISAALGKLLEGPNMDVSPENFTPILDTAKKKLLAYAQEHGLNNDMATTLTLLVLMPEKAFIGWCGDSRVYHIRNGEILYKTEDHSLVNSLVKNGEITQEEARHHSKRNVILKAITADDAPPELESCIIELVREGDYFLLCSDGLLENLSENDIRYLLSDKRPPDTGIVNYIRAKCEGQTRDNYSMYIVEIGTGFIASRPKPRKKPGRILLILALILITVMSALYYFGGYRLNQAKAEIITPVDSLPEIKIVSVDSAEEDVTSAGKSADSVARQQDHQATTDSTKKPEKNNNQ